MAYSQFPIITKYGSLKTYKENYQKDLEVYFEEDEDNREIYYLEKDLLAHKEYLEHLQTKEIEIDELGEHEVNETIEKRNARNEIRRARHEFNYTKNERRINRNKNIIEFIKQRITELGTEPITQPKQIATALENSLNWQGSELQFAELTKALFETKLISPEITQKEFFETMKQFFNVKDYDNKEKLKGIRARTKDLTPFINIIETSLNNWIKNKD